MSQLTYRKIPSSRFLAVCRMTCDGSAGLPTCSLKAKTKFTYYANFIPNGFNSMGAASAAMFVSHPLSAPFAQDLVSVPAAEAYVERVFSICGDLTSVK